MEYFLKESDIMKDMVLYQETLEPKNGYLTPSGKHGVVIEFDETAIAKFKIS